MLELEKFLTITKTFQLRVMLELERVFGIRKRIELKVVWWTKRESVIQSY